MNFPAGAEDGAAAAEEAAQAVGAGADEIDMVLPWRAVLRGDAAVADAVVRAVRAATPAPCRLKVILETGELKRSTAIAEASRIAIEGGADFLKTSTGKVGQGATPEAAGIMIEAIRARAVPVGIKIAGGVRTVADAAAYLALADAAMGPRWADAGDLPHRRQRPSRCARSSAVRARGGAGSARATRTTRAAAGDHPPQARRRRARRARRSAPSPGAWSTGPSRRGRSRRLPWPSSSAARAWPSARR